MNISDAQISMMVSPEDGNGESWYFEVTRFGEVWDGTAETETEARAAAAALLGRMVQMQTETGRTASGAIRHAICRGQADKVETIRRYLPRFYSAEADGEDVLIVGVDNAGWTLREYVIPRLASGLYPCEEVPA